VKPSISTSLLLIILNINRMATKIFVNLPVKDLQQSMNFFSQLGYTFNQQFTNEKAACMVISEDIYAMLLTEPFFEGFIPGKTIADTSKTKEVLVCLSSDSKEAVNSLVDKAVAAGANEFKEPQDHGFMFLRSFEDLDGHIWEIMWMDPAAVAPQVEEEVMAG
jgi:predicted lactoylglutathione lyase